jgi:hypothetical protein
VYNLLWGLAWLVFMRNEWLGAGAGARSLPWSVVWMVWVSLSLGLGIGCSAYIRGRRWQAALAAGLAVWIPLTIGMGAWRAQTSFSLRVVVLDSVVNLVALVGAGLMAGRVYRATGQTARPA